MAATLARGDQMTSHTELNPRDESLLDQQFAERDKSEIFVEDRITATVDVSAPPTSIENIWKSLRRLILDYIAFIGRTIAVSTVHGLFYGALAVAALIATQYMMRNIVGISCPDSFRSWMFLVGLFILSFCIVLGLVNLGDWQWWLHNQFQVPTWLLGQRKSWLKETIRLGNNAVFIGGTPITFSFNEFQLMAASAHSTFEMRIDRSLLEKAEIVHSTKDWQGNRDTPLVVIKLKNGSVLPIHGAYFEKQGAGKTFAENWVKDFNVVFT